MELLINELSDKKFEVIINADQETIHKVFISNQTYLDLTSKKISKKELVKFSFEFLLEREPNTAILSSFDLIQISKYFPEYFTELRDYCIMKI
ncbi:hypothetical protein OBA40_03255 [Alphaproteobacteria bacterium]|nr:hypothetical protein [Alphaproteobacteria bacterium]